MINEMIKQGYQIHFKGETLPGSQTGDVKKKLASLFGLGDDKANAMFNGKQIVLKKDLDEDTAKKYLHVLQKIGAKTYIYPELPASNQDDLEKTGRFSVGLKTCPSCKSIQKASEYCKDCGAKLDGGVEKAATPGKAANPPQIKAPTLRKNNRPKANLPKESILSLAAKNTVNFGKPKQTSVTPAKPTRHKLHLGTTKPTDTVQSKASQRITPPPKQQTVQNANQARRITPVNQALPVRSESRQAPAASPNAAPQKTVRPAAQTPVKRAQTALTPAHQGRSQRRPLVRPNNQAVQVRTKQLVPMQGRATMPGVPALARRNSADLSTDGQLQALENRQPAIGALNKEHEDEIKALQKNAMWGINLGVMLLIAVYFVDMLAQSVGIDISSKPYLLALLPFPVGCWFYAISKGYPGAFGGIIGLANIPGVALLALMPVRYEHESRFEMGRGTIVAIVALGLSAYWGYSYVHQQNVKERFINDIAQLHQLRSDYPAGIIEADENRFTKVVHKMEKLLVTGPRIIKSSHFRPTEVTELSDILFQEFTGFFTWVNYQRYLHHTQVGKIPEFLSRPAISQLVQELRGKLDNGLIEADDSRLNQAYNDWILGVPVTDELTAISKLHVTINHLHDRIQAYVDKYGKMPVSFETMGKFKPDAGQFKVDSVNLDQNGVLTLITGNQDFAGLNNKSIVFTGLVNTKVTRKRINGKRRRVVEHELHFFRIGGNLSNRYMKEPFSLFSKW